MRPFLARPPFLFVVVALLLAGPAAAQFARFPTAPLTIVTVGGPQRFTVEVATTPVQMEQGLMFRQSLARDAGMIFDFGAPVMATMWMKNTLIPLDMLFVDAQGHVIGIHDRAVPQSLDTIAAPGPARAVIELNGGTAARLGIVAGGTGSCGQSAGRRAWFTSRAAAQASATGPTCPSLSGLLTVRIV